MPSKDKSRQIKLKRLIAEQEKDKQSRHVFPESITPRNPVLFARLTLRLKACFILSFFMPRREIAKVLNITPCTVTTYRKRGYKRLLPEERARLVKIKKENNRIGSILRYCSS